MVGHIMARNSFAAIPLLAIRIDVVSFEAATRRVTSPGTLVFLGRAR